MSQKEPVDTLLVEDDETAGLTYRAILESARCFEYNIVHVCSLNEACMAMYDRQFDLILLDLNLPDSKGVDTVRRVRLCAGPYPRIIVITGQDDDKIEVSALRADADEFIVKCKYDNSQVIRLIRNVMVKHYRGLEISRVLAPVGESMDRTLEKIEKDPNLPPYPDTTPEEK